MPLSLMNLLGAAASVQSCVEEPQLTAVLGPVIHAHWLQKGRGGNRARRFWPTLRLPIVIPAIFRPREKNA